MNRDCIVVLQVSSVKIVAEHRIHSDVQQTLKNTEKVQRDVFKLFGA